MMQIPCNLLSARKSNSGPNGAGKPTVQRGIEEGLFDARIGWSESQL